MCSTGEKLLLCRAKRDSNRAKRGVLLQVFDLPIRQAFGCLPGELSKRQASEFIDLLRKPAGDSPAERPSPAPSATM